MNYPKILTAEHADLFDLWRLMEYPPELISLDPSFANRKDFGVL